MQCPNCNGEDVVKNGHRYGKQCYRCKQCKRQFVEFYSERGYSEDARQICLRMYCNGMGFRQTVSQLTHEDKLRLIHFLLLAVAKEEGCNLETTKVNPEQNLLNQLASTNRSNLGRANSNNSVKWQSLSQ
jgi:hypothetical protein